MPEIELTCPDCSEIFIFTEEEQAQCEAYAFPPPTFCPSCHQRRKSAKEDARGGQRRGNRPKRRR